MQHVQIEHGLPERPEIVFEWFTVPELLTQWWPTEAHVDLRVGGAYRLSWSGPGVTLRGEFRVVDPPARLSYTWSWDHDDLPARTVDIELRADGDGTQVHLSHEADTDDEASDYRDGWTHFLGRLDDALRGR